MDVGVMDERTEDLLDRLFPSRRNSREKSQRAQAEIQRALMKIRDELASPARTPQPVKDHEHA